MAKFCLAAATRHAATRRQFGRPLADFELVKKKLAYLAATAYAMEATTYETAALIDRGDEDYMLETAILKVFSTEALWQGVYETLQVFGGQGYFSDEPFERMMRDARINTIGEGANEVLLAFIAVVGMRDVGLGLKSTLEELKRPVLVPAGPLVVQPRTHEADGSPPRRAGRARGAQEFRGAAGPACRPVRGDRRARADDPPRDRSQSAAHPGTDRKRGHRPLYRVVHAGSARFPACRQCGRTRRSRGRRTFPVHGLPPLRPVA